MYWHWCEERCWKGRCDFAPAFFICPLGGQAGVPSNDIGIVANNAGRVTRVQIGSTRSKVDVPTASGVDPVGRYARSIFPEQITQERDGYRYRRALGGNRDVGTCLAFGAMVRSKSLGGSRAAPSSKLPQVPMGYGTKFVHRAVWRCERPTKRVPRREPSFACPINGLTRRPAGQGILLGAPPER